MPAFFTKHRILLTLLTVVALVVIGLFYTFIYKESLRGGDYDRLILLLLPWLALMSLGAVMTVVASVVFLYFWFRNRSLSPQWHKIWSRVLLFGLWLLLVGGGTCVLWSSGARLMPL